MAHSAWTRKSEFLLALPAAAFLVLGIGASEARGGGARGVGPGGAEALIRENARNRDFVVLDVRTPGEYERGHLAGAVLVDYRSPRFREEVSQLDRTKSYLVYCRTGNRSGRALEVMRELGFRTSYHLEGGIERWLEEGRAVVR